jgi:hypothetical protein
MPLSISGYALEPPRFGAANSPYTAGPNVFVPQTLLPGTFEPSGGSINVPTSVSMIGILSPGNTIVFLSQLGVTYTIDSVFLDVIILTDFYSAPVASPPIISTIAYCPQIGTEAQAYAEAYPTSEDNPRDDYLVLVTSELAPGTGTSYPIADVLNNNGAIQLLVGSTSNLVNGQTVIVSGVNGVPAANGTFTITILDSTDVLLNGSTFAGTYSGGGSMLVLQGIPGMLVNAGFGWTKNEIVARFDYDMQGGRFRTLPGGPIVVAGTLSSTANTTRLKVPAPFQVLSDAPFRLSLGTFGSGTTQTVALVDSDSDFGTPPPGTTELSLATGNLNWNSADLTTYNGESVQFQQQQYFALGTSTGNIGTLSTSPTAPSILLNPIPGHGQSPLLRIGYLYWMTVVEVSSEAHFTPFPGPAPGIVEWALTTGRLNFSQTDTADNEGTGVYYDGTLFAKDVSLPRQNIGTIGAPSNIAVPIPATGDIIFSIASKSNQPYYQFPNYSVVSSFSSGGTQGTVEILQSSGAVRFSSADQSNYSGQEVTVVFGDLPLDHGLSLRLFRCPVDLDGKTPNVKDVTAVYSVTNAVWASPIQASPLVFLPSVPVDDDTLVITVGQGTGTFTGTLNPVGGSTPIAGLGYTINFDTKQLNFAQRFEGVEIPLLVSAGYVQLPNPLVLASNIEIALETGTDTNNFLSLTAGSYLVDATAGMIYFPTTFGLEITNGSTATFSGTTFTDPSANFVGLQVQAGDNLIVVSDTRGKAKGLYTITAIPSSTTLTVDVAPPSGSGELSYEILRGKEILADRFFETVLLIDPTTSIERIVALGTIQPIVSGSATFPNAQTLYDVSATFDSVLPGDTITLTSGPGIGSTYLVLQANPSAKTLTPATPFTYFPQPPHPPNPTTFTYTVTRRLQVPLSYLGLIRFRYGLPNATNPSGVFSTLVTTVAEDSDFSDPITLSQGTVQVSQATGNLNFAQADVTAGGTVYVSRRLTLGTDYQVQAQLGLIQFQSRLLTNEEVLMTYTQAPPNTSPPTPPGPPITNERGTFLVRKELAQPHSTPTSTLFFNPSGKSVATVPQARVFRGGRPQVTNTQVLINPGNPPSVPSSMTFLPDNILTDALPHGAVVAPNENVYIDYYVYQAMGGERTLTVLNPPLLVASVSITDGANSFAIAGNQTANFPDGFLMSLSGSNGIQVYQIGTSSYNATTLQTTVTLSGSQTFQTDETSPPLQVASGPTPLTSVAFTPSYFSEELAPYLTVARGMSTIIIPEDKTGVYKSNVVVYFTDSTPSFTDFYLVTGSNYDATSNVTTVTLSTATLRQYTLGQQILYWSVRPVYTQAPTTVQTSLTPISVPQPQPVIVARRVSGTVGKVLSTPVDYSIDNSGTIIYVSALSPDEEFDVFYTGHQIISAGPRVEVSYTATIVPDLTTNGLLGQTLNADYTIFTPDNFYFRVETMTNFKGQVAQEIQQSSQSSTSGSGPMTSNTSVPQLYAQGKPSIWFPPGDYSNHDLIAQACLKFFNDAINALEDALHCVDGRIVGDVDGRFLFDGVIDRYDYYTYNNPAVFNLPAYPEKSNIYNQIDDYVQMQPGPLPSYPDFLTYFQQAYTSSPISRFFPTYRNIVMQTPVVVPTGADTGAIVGTYDFSPLTSLPGSTFKRYPRAQILFDTPYGANTFFVDDIVGDIPVRPPWTPPPPPSVASIIGMLVVVVDLAGNYYVDESDNATVISVTAASGSTPAQITISGIVHTPVGTSGNPPSPPGPYLSAVPAGATIYVSPMDVCVAEQQEWGVGGGGAMGTYNMSYGIGHDVNVDMSTGNVLFQHTYWPLDGNSSFKLPTFIIPESAYIVPVATGDLLEADNSGVAVTYTTPYQFPALTGSTLDDDGNQTVPIVGPTFDGETTEGGGGALNVEVMAEASGSPFRTTTTTPPYLGTGGLDTARTTITLTSGIFPSPIPKQYDLVRIVSGANGTSDSRWRRITSVQNFIPPAFITVATADAWPVHDTGFKFSIAVSSTSVTVGTATLSGTTLTDSTNPFLSGNIAILGNVYGIMTVTANSYNTTTLDTIVAIPPSTATAGWGSITSASAVSVGDIVTGPGISSTSPVTITQIGPGSSIQLSQPTTGGSVTGGVFEIQLTQPPPIAQTVTVVGNTYSASLNGSSASVSSVATPLATITGLTGISQGLVGQQITFSGAASPSNNGSFPIAAYVSPTSLQITNATAISPDGNNGSISWTIPPSPTIDSLLPSSTAGYSIGDSVTGPYIAAGSVITQIGPGAALTLNQAATFTVVGTTISITTVAPPTPWSTTVDDITEAIFDWPTQATTEGLYPGLVVTGTGIPYAPPLVETTLETVVSSSSFTLSAPATTSNLTGSPLSGNSEIITIQIPPAVYAGWTVVMTSGLNAGYRRQIASIQSPNQITLDSAFPSPSAGGSYRIDNPLNTYNGVTFQQILAATNTEISTILTRTAPTPPPYVPNSQSEQNALLSFFSTMFTTIVGPSSQGDVSGTMLTDTTVNFLEKPVTTSYLVYVHLGSSGIQLADQGIYGIASVVDEHHLMVTPAFPSLGTVTYEVVSVFGVSTTTLQSIFTIFSTNAGFITQTQAFQTLLQTPVPVLISGSVDGSIYANGINDLNDDLGNRWTQVNDTVGRLFYLDPTNVNGIISIIQAALSTSDNLYAKRYAWINARINLLSGYLILKNTAQAAVAANEVTVTNNLIQLLTVQGS